MDALELFSGFFSPIKHLSAEYEDHETYYSKPARNEACEESMSFLWMLLTTGRNQHDKTILSSTVQALVPFLPDYIKTRVFSEHFRHHDFSIRHLVLLEQRHHQP